MLVASVRRFDSRTILSDYHMTKRPQDKNAPFHSNTGEMKPAFARVFMLVEKVPFSLIDECSFTF